MSTTATPTRRPSPALLLGGGGLLLVAAYLSLGVGVAELGLRDLLTPTPEQWQVLTVSRIPRAAAVLLAGAALSVAGLIMQRLTQNRFVEPTTTGTTPSWPAAGSGRPTPSRGSGPIRRS